MNTDAAIAKFWNSFSLPAFEENSVPTGKDAPDFPYITFETAKSSLGREVPLNASIWYRTTSWGPVYAKRDEIGKKLTTIGIKIPVDGGSLHIKKNNPIFAQNMTDPKDNMIKRELLSVVVAFYTN